MTLTVGSVIVKSKSSHQECDRFILRGLVNSRAGNVLLDSGAMVNVIHSKFVSPGRIKPSRHILSTANGKMLNVEGTAEVTIELMANLKIRKTIEMFVVKDLSQDCILGVPGLSALNVTMQFGKNHGREKSSILFVDAIDQIHYGNRLSEGQQRGLCDVLQRYKDLFDTNLGATGLVKHSIDTGDNPPIKRSQYRIPLAKQAVIEEHIQKMLEKDVIRESNSPWNSPIVLVKKKDNSDRFCVDYTHLNRVTKKNAYPLPRIDDLLEKIGSAKYFTALDMASGYWQIKMNEDDQEKTAFSSTSGHWEFKVMPFGLTNAPATFQKLMHKLFRQKNGVHSLLDDILIFTETWEEHLRVLEEVLEILKTANLKLQAKKCHFGKEKIRFLGYIVDEKGISTDPEKTAVIEQYPEPKKLKELRAFLGLANYYNRFIPNFAEIADPLFKLTRKGEKYVFAEEQKKAFQCLKQRLTSAPVLMYPKLDIPFELDIQTDASGIAMGAVVSQKIDGEEHPIAYGSRRFMESEKRYAAIEKEAAAVIWALDHFKSYLLGSKFTIISDHLPLRWLAEKELVSGRLARWQLKLKEYDGLLDFDFRPGKENSNADALSRISLPDDVFVNALESHGIVSNDELKRIQNDGDAKRIQSRLVEGSDGILRYKNDRIYIPAILRGRVMKSLHGGPVGSHIGSQKLSSILVPVCYWPRMHNEIVEFVRKCGPCALAKTSEPRPAPLSELPTVFFPFERIAMDFTGPFPVSENGKKYLAVVVDHFSRYVHAVPVSDESASTAIAVLEQVINTEGKPKHILSDRGSCFMSREFQLWCSNNNIQHLRTSVNHPQCDGMAERFMRSIKGMIRADLIQRADFGQKSWIEGVQNAVRQYNNSVHKVTGVIPFEIVRGRTVVPRELAWLKPVTESRNRQTRIIWNSVTKMDNERRRRIHDQRNNAKSVKLRELFPGEKVFRKNLQIRQGVLKSLSPRWDGPFEVVRKVGAATYVIKNSENPNFSQIIHVDKLISANTEDVRYLPRGRGRPRLFRARGEM